MQAIFSGRAPQCSGFTAGGATATVDQASVTKYQSLLTQIKAFVGEPTDFLTGCNGNFNNGQNGTMMFDVVAAAHVFPEYFWIGNAYGQFMANGWGEEAGHVNLTGDFGVLFPGGINNPDQRAIRRGWKTGVLPGEGAKAGAPCNALNILNIGESVAGSRYKPYSVGGQLNANFRHPWNGVTYPDPDGSLGSTGYSWLKSPRYDTVGDHANLSYKVFEVGPLARQVVNGTYWGGILNGQGTALGVNGLYPIAPVWGQTGPDCDTGADALGAALKTVYASLTGVTGGPNLSTVTYNGDSVIDRIAARTTETRILIDEAQKILNDLQGTIGGDGYGPSGCTDRGGENVPVTSTAYRGYGMSEASRGALSHWITMQNGKTTSYQCVVPTTWNASPRDANGNPGPAEKSLENNGGLWIADPNQPIEIPRVTHSYDFCIACAVHLITPKGDVVKVDVPALPG
jgi:Ni,Fe-hydrogenase I large subunit